MFRGVLRASDYELSVFLGWSARVKLTWWSTCPITTLAISRITLPSAEWPWTTASPWSQITRSVSATYKHSFYIYSLGCFYFNISLLLSCSLGGEVVCRGYSLCRRAGHHQPLPLPAERRDTESGEAAELILLNLPSSLAAAAWRSSKFTLSNFWRIPCISVIVLDTTGWETYVRWHMPTVVGVVHYGTDIMWYISPDVAQLLALWYASVQCRTMWCPMESLCTRHSADCEGQDKIRPTRSNGQTGPKRKLPEQLKRPNICHRYI